MTIYARAARFAAVVGIGLSVLQGFSGIAVAQELQTIRISAVPGSIMGVDFRAGIAEGFFARHGLKLEIAELATGTNNITATINGSADIGYADIFAGLSSISNGFDIGLVAPNNGLGQNWFVLVREDSDIATAKDLEKRTVALGAPPQFKAITSAWLDAQGADPSAVSFTIVQDQTTYGSLLETRQVDAIATASSVNAFRWIADHKFRLIGERNLGKLRLAEGSPIAGWWVTRQWYDANTELATRFRDALRESIAWYSGLSIEERARHFLDQTTVDLVALDKKTPGVLELTAGSYPGFKTPVDLEKLRVWIEIGARYANVPKGVDLEAHILPTSRN
ncbi:ABC transporter substrate-binding protein [Mesorhizobium sp. DCY119]|nr:ABC transporter substrate-binding protein [Mesorhizobium sp. DCY119]RJG46284.1 hypothetical protein D3Y55_19915 [Mesorhizobium sp. DCY119]